MKDITLEELLEAGCHFGHQVTRQNPKARDFVFEARDNVHIIDLTKTKEGLEEAAAFVKDLSAKNGTLLVVGTKRQAKDIVEKEVKKAQTETAQEEDSKEGGIYFVTTRWIGGILTNYSEVAKNFKKLKDIRSRLANEIEKAKFTKREIGEWEKEKLKLEHFYGGVENMKSTPDALFIIDTHLEELAVREASRIHIKTVGIVDTNADPFVIDYVIPANDDAVGSIQLITSYLMDAWIEGKQKTPAVKDSEKKEEKNSETEGSKEKSDEAPKKRGKKKKTESQASV